MVYGEWGVWNSRDEAIGYRIVESMHRAAGQPKAFEVVLRAICFGGMNCKMQLLCWPSLWSLASTHIIFLGGPMELASFFSM